MWTKVMILGLISVSTAAFAVPLTSSKCPVTMVVNHTNKWTNGDQRALNRARNRCVMIFLDAPCLKTFYKLDEFRYNAKCGKKRN